MPCKSLVQKRTLNLSKPQFEWIIVTAFSYLLFYFICHPSAQYTYRFLCVFSCPTHRLSEAEWRPGAGALSGRNLPLSHYLSSLPHAHAACSVGRGLRLCEAAASSHLPQSGFYGTAAAVWDWHSLSGMKTACIEGIYFLINSLTPWHSGRYKDLNVRISCLYHLKWYLTEGYTLWIQRKAICAAGIT